MKDQNGKEAGDHYTRMMRILSVLVANRARGTQGDAEAHYAAAMKAIEALYIEEHKIPLEQTVLL